MNSLHWNYKMTSKLSLRPIKTVPILFFIWSCWNVVAQGLPFQNDINTFKQVDLVSPPSKNQILFVGSSSFTLWKDVQQDFPGFPILNRAFGGSNLLDVIRYAPDIISPYKAKQVVIYCGENDLAGDTTVSGQEVFRRFKRLVRIIRKDKEDRPILYVSMKPSPSRLHLIHKFKVGNHKIRRHCSNHKNMNYANIYDAMLDATYQPRQELFLEDKLHMTRSGYEIWKKVIAPYLVK